MAETPQFNPLDVAAGVSGWDAVEASNWALVKQWLYEQPTQIKRAYRVSSTSTPHKPDIVDLKDFGPLEYEGCMFYLMDPETVGTNGKLICAQDTGSGVRWEYIKTFTAVTGIA